MRWLSTSLRRLGAVLGVTAQAASGGCAPADGTPGKGTLVTDSGMFALWDRQAFLGVVSFETWEPELVENEGIERHIRAGHLVPVGIHSDGVFDFAVRVGSADAPAVPSERERRYLTVSSEPYRVRSPGRLHLSGIEYIDARPDATSVMTIDVPAGTWAVTVHLLEWDSEPGMKDAQGRPAPAALPDFLLLLNPAAGTERFRESVETFDMPGGGG
ncbi:MAG TPA: hypothetical protein VLK84_04950 [Longimicrobium sp.]|nr:hypothetical protein [Longimicrobium sp.]